MPTIIGTITEAGVITIPDCGSSKPIALNRVVTSATNPRPATIPRIEASIPSTIASVKTVARTCRDDAPSVRNMPNSRVRWATVIENVLKIRKAPTKTEIPAKTSRNVVRKPKPSLMSADCWAASSAPVFASSPWADPRSAASTARPA